MILHSSSDSNKNRIAFLALLSLLYIVGLFNWPYLQYCKEISCFQMLILGSVFNDLMTKVHHFLPGYNNKKPT